MFFNSIKLEGVQLKYNHFQLHNTYIIIFLSTNYYQYTTTITSKKYTGHHHPLHQKHTTLQTNIIPPNTKYYFKGQGYSPLHPPVESERKKRSSHNV